MQNNTQVLVSAFRKMYDQLDREHIKETVDDVGIDAFISRCARYAAMSGAASGFGGFTTMIVGVPVDVVNNVFQQFRVTLAVIYSKKGFYKISFTDFMKVVGISLGVEAGATVGKSVLIAIANKILVRLSATTAWKAVPFFGAVIGGGTNYAFIRFIGTAMKGINMDEINLDNREDINEDFEEDLQDPRFT